MVALRIYANENKTKYNYFICINSAKENVENNTDIFESTKLMLGRKTLDYVDGSLDINTSTTRQMPLRIMLLGVDAYNHTEETLNEIYQLGRSALQVPYLDKSQSVSFNLNNKKYKASNEIDELGRISRKEFTVDNVTKFYKNYTYNKTRPTEEVDKNSLITTYTYDDMGNIITKSNINKSYAYGYDSLNRLVSEQTNDYTINYLYNSNGNMHTKTVIKGNDTINYTYRYSSNSLIKITKEVNGEVVNEDNITYNKLYPIKINNVDYEWDNNNLIRIGTNTYEYNSSNIRTKKTVGTKVYTYTLDNTNIIKEHILDTTNNIDVTLEYIYDANNTLVGVIENENIYYYDRDITGLILGLVDINGNYVVKYTYTAYGEVEKDILVNTNISTYNPFMYKGYYYDVETNLYYCKSRYYSPELCRFISPDSIEYLDPQSINGLNLYCYCMNNPIMYADPSGHMPEWLQWTLGGLIVVGAIALSICTAGLATPIATAVGGGLFGAIVGGAVAGAIGGAIAGFGVSYGSQVIENGFQDTDWNAVIKSTVSGAISGAIAGGVFGGIKYAYSAKSLANSVSGLSKAQTSLNNAWKPLSNVKNLANMPFSGANIARAVGQAAANYNAAYTNLIFAGVNNTIASLAFAGMYAGAQFGLKQLIVYGINQIW